MSPLFVLAVLLVIVAVTAALIVTSRRRPPGTARPSEPGPVAATRPPTGPGTTRAEGLGPRVRALFRRGVSEDTWEVLEDLLLKADAGPRGAGDLVARVRARWSEGEDPASLLHDEIEGVFAGDAPFVFADGRLTVVMVVGVNGTGKTTTIGKLAARWSREGKAVCLAASDTFRAAAGEQLEVWADRAGAQLVSQERGADPGAVAFDAVRSATARGADVLIVDTAGRLHTKTPLMDELAKVKRVIEKAGASVDETLLVLDATTGQNGIVQARAFTDAVDVTGIVLTKMDGSARGGSAIAVREELGHPIRFVGVGEGLDDLRPFDPVSFADRLLEG